MFEIPYAGRYALVLMSLFAMYCGALYNEFLCLPMNFGSAWSLDWGLGTTNNTFSTERNGTLRWNYAFGVDPVWKGATNELLFYNSLKMKMAVIIGIVQVSSASSYIFITLIC